MANVIKKTCEKYHIDYKFIKFLFIGLLNTIFGYSIYALFIFIKFHYTIAVLISTIFGILFNFKTTGVIVFKNNNNKLIFKFIGVYAFMYFVSISLLKLLLTLGFENMYINNAVIIVPCSLASFIMMKKFVFN